MAYNSSFARPITISSLSALKSQKRKIVMLTAYDVPTARFAEQAGVDVLLVGDSVGMTKLGYETTLPVTVEDMLHHVKAVRRGAKRCLVVADMPYLSYEIDSKSAIRAAGRMVKEGGAHAVKVEGGTEIAPIIRALRRVHIPVIGHIGLTPQAVNRLGGYRVQGRTPAEARRLMRDARALQDAGCRALVLECVPAALAGRLTRSLSIPTIGIGAGPHCDGQVLVCDDLLGLSDGPPLTFVKRYAELGKIARRAISAYCNEVRSGEFPAAQHSFSERP